ncbi:surface-adhesin E family protein [Moraxella atlantae]|uniref:surface-adhesin E family protein n=1 Tax=Faucicola atlantae TaxID=34059 RepID=UPI0037526D6F
MATVFGGLKKLAVVWVALASINNAVAANWVYLAKTSDGSFKDYIDVESVKKLSASSSYPYSYLSASNSGQIVSFFVKMDYAKAQKTADGKFYNYIVSQQKGDCATNKISTQGAIFYTKGGSVVYSFRNSYDDWQTVYPDTLGESELNVACIVAGYRSTP